MSLLNELNEAQREEYRRSVSKAVGLDPDANLLDYIWMPSENGMKNLVLYCRRGAAEILRGARGISVTKTTKEEGPGYVAFIVEGTDKTGRTEIAVGSASTEGLRGEKLAYSVMTASTRALRRLTLQFVGNGLLDESEVNAQAPVNVVPAASAAQLAGSPVVVPPVAAPTQAPGRDITPPKSIDEDKAKAEAAEKQAKFEAEQAAMREEASRQLKADKNPVIPTTEVVTTSTPAPVTGMNEAVIEPAKVRKPRAPRKPKNTVTLDTPAPASAPEIVVPKVDPPTLCFDCGEILKDHEYVDGKGYICKPKVSEAPQPAPIGGGGAVGTGKSIDPPLAEPPTAAPASVAAVLTAEQFKDFRQRLRPYSNDILPKQGGMLPSEGIGGPSAKLSLFALKYVGATSVEKLSLSQWEDMFDFLDTYNKENGAKALVAYINEAIGAK